MVMVGESCPARVSFVVSKWDDGQLFRRDLWTYYYVVFFYGD
jgi:hypothetical protein